MMAGYAGLITAGAGILQSLTAKKAPKIDPYNPTPIKNRKIDDYLPNSAEMMDMQSDQAMSMMSGEIPQSVKDSIESFAAEKAIRGGYGASTTRTGNLVARDFGLSALDLMQQGQQLGGFLIRQSRDLMSDDLAIDISNANMAHDAWASNAQLQMDRWRGKASQRANTWGNVTSGLAGYATAQSNAKKDADYLALANRKIDIYKNKASENEMYDWAMKPETSL